MSDSCSLLFGLCLLLQGTNSDANPCRRLSRALGTILGLIGSSALLWFYWPEAHGYFTHPFAVFLMATCVGCDAAYPFVLARVRATERELPDGRLVAGDLNEGENAAGTAIRKKRRD